MVVFAYLAAIASFQLFLLNLSQRDEIHYYFFEGGMKKMKLLAVFNVSLLVGAVIINHHYWTDTESDGKGGTYVTEQTKRGRIFEISELVSFGVALLQSITMLWLAKLRKQDAFHDIGDQEHFELQADVKPSVSARAKEH
jgi:hypothetical protein